MPLTEYTQIRFVYANFLEHKQSKYCCQSSHKVNTFSLNQINEKSGVSREKMDKEQIIALQCFVEIFLRWIRLRERIAFNFDGNNIFPVGV